MLIHVGFDITIQVSAPTPVHTLLDLHPDRQPDILLEDPIRLPASVLARRFDLYGNVMRRFIAPAGSTRLSYRAIVRESGEVEKHPVDAAEIPVGELPDECLPYLAPSRYCDSDELGQLAWDTFGATTPGYERVKAIVDYAHNQIRFDYQNASSTRTAVDAHQDKTGVCRDYAHLAIALCRALNMPARYVNGYLGDIGVPADPAPMDFSAWLEVFIGGEWVTFDARHNKPRTGRIVIARGRDAADVAMVTSFGPHYLAEFHVVCEEVASTAPQLDTRQQQAA